MKKNLLWLAVLLIGFCGMVSCEKDADMLEIETEANFDGGIGIPIDPPITFPTLTVTASRYECYEGESITFTASLTSGYEFFTKFIESDGGRVRIIQPMWSVRKEGEQLAVVYYGSNLTRTINFNTPGVYFVSFSGYVRSTKGSLEIFLSDEVRVTCKELEDGECIPASVNLNIKLVDGNQLHVWATCANPVPKIKDGGLWKSLTVISSIRLYTKNSSGMIIPENRALLLSIAEGETRSETTVLSGAVDLTVSSCSISPKIVEPYEYSFGVLRRE